jgi:hypothetical protein
MAGGAIMGVIDAIANAVIKGTAGSTAPKEAVHIMSEAAFEGIPGEVVGTLALAALSVFVVVFSRRATAR